MPLSLSRRRFAETLGAAAGAALLGPRWAGRAEASLSRGEADDYIQLNSNENPYGPSPKALEALARSSAIAGRYPDAVEEEVRDAIARHHGVGPSQIVLGCGSSEVLQMADAAFLGAGRTVVAAEPTFEAVLLYARVTRASGVKVPLTADFRHDLPRMAAACDARTGLVYLCNPNNPTGTVVAGDELAKFLARVPPTIPVLVDEAYHHFVESPGYRSAADLLERHPNVVVARTFSKIYGMAGMRLGYGVASEANANALRAWASWNNTNAAGLAIAQASLADPDLVPRQRKILNDTRRWLCAELTKEGRRFIPSETNFVMIHLGREVTPVIAAFRGRRILVGRKFPSLSNWMRVSIGRPEEMASFHRALKEIVPAAA